MLTNGIRTLIVCLLVLSISSACYGRPFKQALPGYSYSFPRDHAAHSDFKTEWWYFTGHLSSQNGSEYGYELTFFRSGIENQSESGPWNLGNIYLAHFAITDPVSHKFFYSEKINRTGLSVAGAREDECFVFNELWSLELLGDRFILRADVPKYGIHLQMASDKSPVIHGKNGVSQKASCKGCASHYYSMTRLNTEGLLFKDGKPLEVKGISWMDHEFGSNQLSQEQSGWDWFSVQLDDNSELMLYVMRRKDGTPDPNSSGTFVTSEGKRRHLRVGEFSVRNSSTWKSPRSAGKYPMDWTVFVPSENLKLTITPVMREQELAKTDSTGVTYWEGASEVKGTHRDKTVSGKAYVEMTGYAEPFNSHI